MYLAVGTDVRTKAATEEIERAWLIGREILDKGRTIPEMIHEYRHIGWKYEHVRQCRMFASVYTREAYDRLLERIVTAGATLGFTMLWKLFTIRDLALRDRIELALISEGWSRQRLQAEIFAAQGRQSHGGRKRRITSADTMESLVRLEQECHRWQKLQSAISDAGHDLPQAVEATSSQISTLISQLREQVTRAMGRRRK